MTPPHKPTSRTQRQESINDPRRPISRDPHAGQSAIRVIANAVKNLDRSLRLANARQLWLLNQQAALTVTLPAERLEPGVLDAELCITVASADVDLKRIMRERWPGLQRPPKEGYSWVVRDGIVIVTAVPEEPS